MEMSEGLKNKVGGMLEPAYLYTNLPLNLRDPLQELATVVEAYHCRGGVVHSGDVFLLHGNGCKKIVTVVDFPYGRNGIRGNQKLVDYVLSLPVAGSVIGFDIVIDLWALQRRKWSLLKIQLQDAVRCCEGREVKAICQLPFVWKYYKNSIESLLYTLVEAGVSVIKDWTTVDNFSAPIELDTDTRLAYTEYIRNLIDKENLSLKIKIAGKINEETAVRYYKAGADILGVGCQKTRAVFHALCKHLSNE